MTKQEEIRERLVSKIKAIRMWATRPDDPLSPEDDADDILKYLHSQGVVIKVGRELPKNRYYGWEDKPNTQWYPFAMADVRAKDDMLEAGYVAVEPLIKE